MSGFNCRCGTSISVCNQLPRSTQPGIPSWVGAVSTSQTAVMPCGWGVKAGMVCVWVAGKTVIPCNTRATSEHFRDQLGIIKRYRNGLFTFTYNTLNVLTNCRTSCNAYFTFGNNWLAIFVAYVSRQPLSSVQLLLWAAWKIQRQ